MSWEEQYKALREIMQWAEAEPGLSYYDIKERAYKERNKAWIQCCEDRKTRQHLAILMRSYRRKHKVPYKKSYPEAYAAAREAKYEYDQEKDLEGIQRIEAMHGKFLHS